MKLKDLATLSPITKIKPNLPVARKLALMERNKVIMEIGEIEVSKPEIIVNKLAKEITPLLLNNRPKGELHWGIYIGEFETKEEAIAEFKSKMQEIESGN